ncbi:MAG TPA: hypothetical protein VNC61_09720 [Acidimicrobiales bacterium]|nr:hypothetical protein [Acidimicrobiales bacterium]
MSRRIDIELTSRRDDGSWTWRAPGAKHPRGSLDGELVPSVAKVGDVLRAEADFELEGITVVSVQAPRVVDTNGGGPERIEVVGSGRDKGDGVSVTLVPGSRRQRDDGDGDRRPRRGAGDRGAGRPGPVRPTAGRSAPGRDGPPSRDRAPRRDGASPGDDRGRGADGAGRPRPTERAGGRPGPETSGRGSADRPSGDRSGAGPRRGREERPQRRDRPRRPEVVTTNRNAALAALSAEQIPVAEQLLRGGIPAVRQAIDEQNTRARSEGRAEISPQPLLTMAEELLPRMTLAAWKDRAVTLRAAGREAPLREMRSVVAGASTVSLDDEGRELVGALREALDSRVAALRVAWLARVVTALDESRVAEALRVAAKPPEPTARIPADLAVRLAETAGSSMAPTLDEAQWKDLLDAVINSPVRRTVKPVGLPAEASPELLTAARHAAGLVPELARLLGLPIPPPPGPRRAGAVAARRG